MLVHLADWCYRQRRLVVVLWIAALAAAFALASSFGGETKQDYLQPGSESQAASETLQAEFPQKAGDTVQVVLHSEDGFSSAVVRTQGGGHLRRRRRRPPCDGCRQSLQRWRRQPDLARRQDRVRPRRARQDRGRVHPRPGQGARRTGPRRRRRHPPGRSRRPGREAVPDGPRRRGGHRPHRRGPDPAVHLRLRGGDGPAAPHRSVRPRHVDRARRAAAPCRRRPGLGDRHRGDGRDRRRHRLRAPHRHPVPQRPRRRTRPTPGDPDRDR